jgi:hypothetical protein
MKKTLFVSLWGVLLANIAYAQEVEEELSIIQELMANKQFLWFGGGAVFLILILIIKKATGH